MKNIKRILLGIIALLIVMFIFSVAVNFFEKREYKYLTFENEWGISDRCYLNDTKHTICDINGILTIVRQFYTEK